MKHFKKQVQKVEKGEWDVKKFVNSIDGDEKDWVKAYSACQIYVEDGGEKFSPQQFIKACCIQNLPNNAPTIEEYLAFTKA